MPPLKKRRNKTGFSLKMKRIQHPLISKCNSVSIKTLPPNFFSHQIITRSKAKLLLQAEENFQVDDPQYPSLKDNYLTKLESLKKKKSSSQKKTNRNEMQRKVQLESNPDITTRSTCRVKNKSDKIPQNDSVIGKDTINDSLKKNYVALDNDCFMSTGPTSYSRNQRDVPLTNILLSPYSNQMKDKVQAKVKEDIINSIEMNLQDSFQSKLSFDKERSLNEKNVSMSSQQIYAAHQKQTIKTEGGIEINGITEQPSFNLIADNKAHGIDSKNSIGREQVSVIKQKLKKISGKKRIKCEKDNIYIDLSEEAMINFTKEGIETYSENFPRKLIADNKHNDRHKIFSTSDDQFSAPLELKKISQNGKNVHENYNTFTDLKEGEMSNCIGPGEELQKQNSKKLTALNDTGSIKTSIITNREETEVAPQQKLKKKLKKENNEFEKNKISTSFLVKANSSCVKKDEHSEHLSEEFIMVENKSVESADLHQTLEQKDTSLQNHLQKTKRQSNNRKNKSSIFCEPATKGKVISEQNCNPQHIKKRASKRKLKDEDCNMCTQDAKRVKQKSAKTSMAVYDNSLIQSEESLISESINNKSSNEHSSSLEFIFTPPHGQQKKRKGEKRKFLEDDVLSKTGNHLKKENSTISDLSLGIGSSSESLKKLILTNNNGNDCTDTISYKALPRTKLNKRPKKRKDVFKINNSSSREKDKRQIIVKSAITSDKLSNNSLKHVDRQKLAVTSLNGKSDIKENNFQNTSIKEINNNNIRNANGVKKRVQDLNNVHVAPSSTNKSSEDRTLEDDQESIISSFVTQEFWKKKQMYNIQQDIVKMERRKLSTFNNMFSSICKTLFNKCEEGN